MIYRIILAETARNDLDAISDWIEERAGGDIADAYDRRIRDRIATLTTFPLKGPLDPIIGHGVRAISFERRLRIAYRVEGDVVEIYRVFHGARSIEGLGDF